MVYWLSSHVGYACQHAGACCRSRWPIPLEATRVRLVREAVLDGRIAVSEPWLLSVADAPVESAGILTTDPRGHCVFHQRDQCAIHGVLGHGALPSACQHFPRVCLTDPRGVFVTLSHFCPTAAWLLFDEGPVSIVEGPSALPEGAEPEGLDARGAWPPSLDERVLMDHESYGLWELHMVNVLAGDARESAPESALGRLRADAERLSAWRPTDGPLIDIVRATSRLGRPAFDFAPARKDPPLPVSGEVRELFDLARAAIPAPLAWPDASVDFERQWARHVEAMWPRWGSVVQRYLAAHAFGSWLAYQGRGLRAAVRGLEAALAVLQVEIVRVCEARDTVLDRASLHEAIRQADLLLRHHADRQALADHLSAT
jgi:hypothetical protein